MKNKFDQVSVELIQQTEYCSVWPANQPNNKSKNLGRLDITVHLPKSIADAIKVKKGDRLRIYTDGDRIYLDRFEEPQI